MTTADRTLETAGQTTAAADHAPEATDHAPEGTDQTRETAAGAPARPAVEELRLRLAGDLHEPGSAGYDSACALFNSMVQRRPALVARCSAPDDVVAALAFARDHDMRVTVRAGGHAVTGASLCDGGLVRASADENPELLWAHRGGGANFGVVTAVELALHPVGPEVLGGLLLHPAERGPELLARFRDTMRNAPEELSLALIYLTGPDEDEIPAELRGQPVVAIAGMYAGPIAEGEAALREIRAFGPPAADLFEPVLYADFQRSLDDPPGYRNYWTVEHLEDLPAAAIDAIHERSLRIPAGPAQLFVAGWGGAVARNSGGSAIAGRDARFVVHPLFLWEDPADDATMIDLGRGYRDLLAPWATGAAYSNFLGDEGERRARAAFAPGAYERLAAIKAEWDPGDVFHATGHVPPAGS